MHIRHWRGRAVQETRYAGPVEVMPEFGPDLDDHLKSLLKPQESPQDVISSRELAFL